MDGQLFRLTPEEQTEIVRKQAIVSRLNALGAFDIRGGSIQVHFDANGDVRRVDKIDTIFRS